MIDRQQEASLLEDQSNATKRTESLLDEITARIPAAEFQAEYFPGGMVRISTDLTAELLQQVTDFAASQGWSDADAFVALLAYGIGAFKEGQARALLEQDTAAAHDELDLLVRDMRAMETQYAVMKFRTWNFLQAYQASALSDGALRTKAGALGREVDRLRSENGLLRAEIARLKDECARLQAAAGPIPAVQPRQSFLERLRGK